MHNINFLSRYQFTENDLLVGNEHFSLVFDQLRVRLQSNLYRDVAVNQRR